MCKIKKKTEMMQMFNIYNNDLDLDFFLVLIYILKFYFIV